MPIARDDVAHLARLSRMDLAEAELDHLAAQLDVIISAANESITEPRDLQRIVRRFRAGEKVSVSFLRDGKQRKVTLVL